MATYVTVAQARTHARLGDAQSPDPYEDDLTLKLDQAEAMVLGVYKAAPADSEEEAILQARVLKVFLWLWRFRGDDNVPQPSLKDILGEDIYMSREPTIA